MKNTTEILNTEIYPAIDIGQYFPELEPKDKGNYWQCICPNCDKPEGYIYKGSQKQITCSRKNNCGYSISLWDHLQGRDGLDQRQTLERLASYAGVTLDSSSGGDSGAAKQRQRQDILEAAQGIFAALLWDPEGAETLQYIRGRGFTEDQIKEYGLGYYPGGSETLKRLEKAGYSAEQAAGGLKWALQGKGTGRDTYKLTVPYRAVWGNMLAIIGRLTGSGDAKYKPLNEYTRDNLIGYSRAKKKDHRGTLVITEGFLDVYAGRAAGIENIVGLAGASFRKEYTDQLHKDNFKSLVFMLDQDKAGSEGTERAIRIAAGAGLRAFVAELPPGKDPLDLYNAGGPTAVKAAIETAKDAQIWQLEKLFSKAQSEPEKHNATEAALDILDSITDPLKSDQFLTRLADLTGDALEALADKAKTIEQRRKRAQNIADLGERLRAAGEQLQGGDIRQAQELLQEAVQDSKGREVKEYRPMLWGDIVKAHKGESDGLKTHYKELDKYLRFQNAGINIIAGRPGHGKTTFMLNLLQKQLKDDNGKTFVFFTYEEPAHHLARKLVMATSGHKEDRFENMDYFIDYIRTDKSNNRAINEAIEQYQNWTASGRLIFISDGLHADQLTGAMYNIADRYDVGAFFVDYIQKIPGDRSYSRQVEIQETSGKILRTQNDLKIPLITGAQLNREAVGKKTRPALHHLRESGDIEQDAATVIAIYREALEDTKDVEAKQQEQEAIKLIVLKNRAGAIPGDIELNYNKPIWTIE